MLLQKNTFGVALTSGKNKGNSVWRDEGSILKWSIQIVVFHKQSHYLIATPRTYIYMCMYESSQCGTGCNFDVEVVKLVCYKLLLRWANRLQ